MKIKSRIASIGSGSYRLDVSLDELELIGAFLYETRLGGTTVYKKAARSLIDSLEDEFDEDFLSEAAAKVDLTVSHVDEDDTIISTLQRTEYTFEV